ncbi:MAG: hypothetical protein Q7S27_05535 [Nanoarchaeota archaeon]|nr:hypothetical protein [Nanoarchaeota archaeon]
MVDVRDFIGHKVILSNAISEEDAEELKSRFKSIRELVFLCGGDKFVYSYLRNIEEKIKNGFENTEGIFNVLKFEDRATFQIGQTQQFIIPIYNSGEKNPSLNIFYDIDTRNLVYEGFSDGRHLFKGFYDFKKNNIIKDNQNGFWLYAKLLKNAGYEIDESRKINDEEWI